MKRFVKCILGFLLLVLAQNILLIPWLVQQEKKRYESDLTMDGEESIVVCSDSQIEGSLNPDLFPELFNASKSGQPFCYTVAKTMDCLRINRGYARVALIPVHFNRLDCGGFKEKFTIDDFQLIIPLLHGEIARIERLLPAITHRLFSRTENDYGKFIVHEKCGFESNPEKMKTYISKSIQGANSNECWKDFENSDFVNRLNRFIEDVKAENCVPVIISTPLHRELREGFVHWEEFNAVISSVTNRHQCLWLDYVAMPFADTEFVDANHLNFKGAERFTKRVRADLLAYGIIKPCH